MPQTRRSFLAASAGAAFSSPLWAARSRAAMRPVEPAGRKLKLLILGGTGFLGPEIVRTAVERGHSMTLFNRGKTAPEMFPDLEQLEGDRDTGELSALEGRDFDAVIDTSAYVPSHVAATAGMFAGTAAHYTIVSTISVYDRAAAAEAGRIDVDSKLETVPEEIVASVKTIRESFQGGGIYYGGFKALCEQAAEKAMPGRVCHNRPGLIVGPRDNTDRFTWWPVRLDRGGEVLCPGNPDAGIQVIDVRDLGEWIIHCVEQNVTGTHNAVGFDGKITFGEFLGACKCASSTPSTLVWASEEFLQANEVGAWMEMPMWIPGEGLLHYSNRSAIDSGLKFRPLGDTIRDTLAWAKEEETRRAMFARTGVKAEKEARLLEAWKKRG